MTEIEIIKDAIQRLSDGEEVSKISHELDYGLTQKQLNYLIYCYLNGDYRQEIGDFLTDINYHSGLTQIEKFAAFIEEYMA